MTWDARSSNTDEELNVLRCALVATQQQRYDSLDQRQVIEVIMSVTRDDEISR